MVLFAVALLIAHKADDSMPKRPKSKSTTEYIPPTHPAFRPYVVALGQLALAWNALHETLALLYCRIMGGSMVNQHLAVWHALKVDRAQRDILIAAAQSNTWGAMPVKFMEDIKWLCGRADALEDLRNDALHSPLLAYYHHSDNAHRGDSFGKIDPGHSYRDGVHLPLPLAPRIPKWVLAAFNQEC
jgi:hypothetical protein